MRATDRLVDRIRQHQQMKVFIFQLVLIVVSVSVLCNVVASLFVELLLRELPISALYVLAIAVSLVPLLSISAYFFSKRYFRGGLSTFVRYTYLFQPSREETTAGGIAESLWEQIDPAESWKTIHASPAATVDQKLVLLLFQSKSTEKKPRREGYWIHQEGEFVYTSFWHARDRFLKHNVLEVPNVGRMSKLCSCEIVINLVMEKKEDNYAVELNMKLEPKSIGPESDELIQDVSVFLRSFVEKFRKSLLRASDKQNTYK